MYLQFCECFRSKRRGCPMRILLRLAEDLHHLVVYELFEQHNHELEPRDQTSTPKQQMFRMSRVNSSRYTLTKLEEGEGGQFMDIESKTILSLIVSYCQQQHYSFADSGITTSDITFTFSNISTISDASHLLPVTSLLLVTHHICMSPSCNVVIMANITKKGFS